MIVDWNKDNGKWQIFEGVDPNLASLRVALVDEVQLMVPSVLVAVNGGRHGYLIADGVLTITGNVATVRRNRDG